MLGRMIDPGINILAVAVGNTRLRFGVFQEGRLHHPGSARHDAQDEIVSGLGRFTDEPGELVVAVASVNDAVADQLPSLLKEAGLGRAEIYQIGRDLPIPIEHTLEEGQAVGRDRLLNALGAYAKAQQACVVVDAGTAVTVDFVDGEGVFQGGAIGPGLQMMLDALHRGTAALPQIRFEPPDPDYGPFGKGTAPAMRLGVAAAVRGMVRDLVDQYADSYGAYPQVVATGGDAPTLFEGQGLVEHIVPDLQLIGIHQTCTGALADQE